MITSIFNNPKVHITVGAVVVAVSIWAKVSAVVLPIFPILGVIFGALLMVYGFSKLQKNEHSPFIFDQVIQDPLKDPLLIQAKKLNMNVPDSKLAHEIINNCKAESSFSYITVSTTVNVFNKNDQKSTAMESRRIELDTIKSYLGYKDKDIDCIAAARAVLGSKEEADVSALHKFAKSCYSKMRIYLSTDLNHYQIKAD
ncbi:MAG: hypothetical protein HZB76_01075 [Chlamydiae bacterium]|nr:hypothetical protein [Chlamydiota bacterium]